RVLDAFGVPFLSIVNWEFARGKKYRYGFPTKDGGYRFNDLSRDTLTIFDEAHRGKGEDTRNAHMLIAAKRDDVPHLLLSATLAHTPREMKASGYCLEQHALFDF